MSFLQEFSERVRSLIWGDPWGGVFPPKPLPRSLSRDGRTIALRVLREYIAELTYYRAGDKGGPDIPFKIPIGDIHVEGYPEAVVNMHFPSIVFLPGSGEYESLGLNSYLDEATRDTYGAGTVIQRNAGYKERFTLEVWANRSAERCAILSGLEDAMSPTEFMAGLRLRMPDYYDQLACFVWSGRTLEDDADNAKGRRRAKVDIELNHEVVRLVNVPTLRDPAVLVDPLPPEDPTDLDEEATP